MNDKTGDITCAPAPNFQLNFDRLLVLGVIFFLSACASRPYSCDNATYPPEFKSFEDGWRYLATVCETRIRPDLFTRQNGVLLSVVIRSADQEVVAEREVFFPGEERVYLNPHWADADSLVVEASTQQESGEKVLIAQFHVNLPAQ